MLFIFQEKEKRKKAAEAQAAKNKSNISAKTRAEPVPPIQAEPIQPAQAEPNQSTTETTTNVIPPLIAEQTAMEITTSVESAENRNEPNKTPEKTKRNSKSSTILLTALEIQDEPMEVVDREIREDPPLKPNENQAPVVVVKTETEEMLYLERNANIPPRAISTPEAGRIDNLTFAAFDISAIPMATPMVPNCKF